MLIDKEPMYKALVRRHKAGKTFALLVIDETAKMEDEGNKLMFQVSCIENCRKLAIPMWFIEPYTGGGWGAKPELLPPTAPCAKTSEVLLKAAGQPIQRLVKAADNAFAETALEAAITFMRKPDYLILLGRERDGCIRQTAMGGIFKHPGATQLGYQMMSCDHLVHGPVQKPEEDWVKSLRAIEWYRSWM